MVLSFLGLFDDDDVIGMHTTNKDYYYFITTALVYLNSHVLVAQVVTINNKNRHI